MAATEQPGDSDMLTMSVQPMSLEQQAELVRVAKVGLQWVSGEISFDAVSKALGKPAFEDEQAERVMYGYYPNGMAVRFYLDKLHPIGGKPSIDFFSIKVDEKFRTNIPREIVQERLELKPVVRGASIDGVRTERSDFFVPEGRIVVPSINRDAVGFNYRKAMPANSLFDVNVGVGYVGEWKNEGAEPTLDNLRKALDLRELYISRHYLTPEELEERNFAKRKQYGYMGLRTGMRCPETGWWEGWSVEGLIDKQVVRQSKTFPEACFPLNRCGVNGERFVDAQWMWSGPFDEHREG
jgi:hypothetical protein